MKPLRNAARKLRSVFRLTPFVVIWFPFSWIMMGLCRLAIITVTFRSLSRFFGALHGVEPVVPMLNKKQKHRAFQIAKLISITARNTPWESNCFPQALVARIMLGIYRIPYALYFGVKRDGTSRELLAHAWVCSGICAVSGGDDSFDEYTVVGCYGAQSWHAVTP
ncbi:lasso peptide biosynthesis B2 protein [Paramylibacter ulvae]|uniref:lasso peptide biosynthesis B2 protein n=1 Tax=Paramylibacter ulvae TaxID=1651968 RepID=UPI00167C24FE|nr:lasso peptide biosynthesis B2 protein [Amylibacter ulvae]